MIANASPVRGRSRSWNPAARVRPLQCILLSCAILALAMPALAQDAEQYNGRVVKKIEFIGLVRLTPDAVRARMSIKEGKPFQADAMRADVKSLVADKIFFNIQSFRVRPFEDGVAVSILGEENVRVLEVSFFGLVTGTREELMPLIKTVAGGLVDQFTLDVDRQAIIDWYRQKGFHFVQVSVEQDKLEGVEGLVIVFKITEGPEVEIEHVAFEGNHAFSNDDLLKAMPKVNESGLFKDAPFVLTEVQRDVVQLTRFYHQEGYLDAEVTLLGWEPNKDFTEVSLRIGVKEGEPYMVRSLTIEGMTLFDPNEVMQEMETKVGGRYRPGVDLGRDIKKLLDRYKERAFIDCDIRESGSSVIDLEKNEVDVILKIVEGERIYVGEVEIKGNIETKDNVIRREIEIFTGEPLDEKKFEKAKRRIFNLQYWAQGPDGFSGDYTDITNARFQNYREAYVTLRDTKRENVKDVIFSVKERDTGSIRFAVGVGSNNGVIGDITYEKDNFDPTDLPESPGDFFDAFTGGGQRLTLSVQPGTRLTRIVGSYYNPRVWDSDFSFRQDGYLSFAFRESWREDRIGERTTIGRKLGEDMFASITMRNELIEINDISHDAPQLVFDFEGERLLSSLQLDWRLLRVDNFVDPTDGYILNVSWEHAGLWGDIDFNQVLATGEYYVPLHEDAEERWHVLRFKGTVGWAHEFGDTRDIPIYERFFAGGANSLRGFQFRGIGPRDNGDPIGGKALWLANAEYSFPLVGTARPGEPSLRGVVFVDSGSLALSWSDSAIGDVRVSGGFGLRIVIPFLGSRPLAFDFGFPFVSQDGDEERVLSFSFGSNF